MPVKENRRANGMHRAAGFDPEAPINDLCVACREVLRQLAVTLQLLAARTVRPLDAQEPWLADHSSAVATKRLV